MAKNTNTKNKAKPAAKLPRFQAVAVDRIDPRKKLLARVAGSVATGLVGSPSPAISTPEKLAEAAVEIAEQILRKTGITPIAEASAAAGDAAA